MAEMSIAELTQRLLELEKKVQVQEDIEQIKQLQIRYQNAHTFNDADGEIECFTDDATFVIKPEAPFVGKGEIYKFFAGIPNGPRKLPKIPTAGHFIVHPLVKVDGDKATGSSLQYCLHSDDVTLHMLFWVQGIYDAEFVKDNGEWKISFLRWTVRSQPAGFGGGPEE